MNKHVYGDGSVCYFELSLPEGQIFALNTHLGTFLHLEKKEKHPAIRFETQLTTTEQSLLFPLLQNFPHYCPYEVLFASFYNGKITEKTVLRARERLQEAQFAGVWDYEMRPLRNALSRMRLKIKDSGIEINSVLETGYLLEYIEKNSEKD